MSNMEKNIFFANPDKSGHIMRSIVAFGIVFILLFAAVSCESVKIDEPEDDSQTFYRYLDDERVYFEISSSKVVVQVGEGVTKNDIKSFFRENASLQVSDISYMRDNGFTLIHFHGSNRNAIIQLANQLQRNETILFVGPVIVDEIGKTAALTNQINIMLKNDDDYSVLQKAIADYDIDKVKQLEFNSRRYLLTVNYFSRKSALQIANELHRTRLFEWAEPNLILFIRFGI